MRKLILRWLFGTDDIKSYMDVLTGSIEEMEAHKKSIEQHNKTINESLETLHMIKKLLKICENHGIDIDKELEQIEV